MSAIITGGTVGSDYTRVTNGTVETITFTSTAITYGITFPSASTVQYTVVGGGGSRGGGGGQVKNGSLPVSTTNLDVIVGAGGAGGGAGVSSEFSTIISLGGASGVFGDGGNGGGYSQGSIGKGGISNYNSGGAGGGDVGGGGGGFGSSNGGNGGNGIISTINGSRYGGGGGGNSNISGGLGGAGGGGSGRSGAGSIAATAGTANSGGGGGSGGAGGAAAGGSGIVILSYSLSTTPVLCFKENTFILTNIGYVQVQDLRQGDLIKTLLHGFVKIYVIGKSEINHHASKERIKDQLYKCTKEYYPEVFEPLILTGCHSILVDAFKEGERDKTYDVLRNIYITDNKYRLPACVDERASVYETPSKYTIYHFALENENKYMNYGVYANGLIVESCSIRYITELSNMEFI